MPTRPTWAEVSLPALTHNFTLIRNFVAPHASVCAVVKCDAYGHGAVECARALEPAGANWFGVTSADEGIVLRSAGIHGRILLMSGMWQGEAEAIVEHGLTPAIWSLQQIESLNAAAQKLGKTAFPIHIEVDTGMSRQGTLPRDLAALLEAARKSKDLCIEGLHSHLASAEVVDASDVTEQISSYQRALEQLAAAEIRPACLHLANSAAIVAHEEAWKGVSQIGKTSETLVRPGLALYGYQLLFVTAGGESSSLEQLPLKPVLAWKSRIIDMREVGAAQGVGYNRTHVTTATTKLATIAVGYGDGLNRRLSSRGAVLVRGEKAPIVGRISMDVSTIDVTAIPGTQIGDEVVLIGEQGGHKLSAWDMARLIDTIPYEVLCNIGKRVPRRYVA